MEQGERFRGGTGFADLGATGIDEALLHATLDRQSREALPRLRMLWAYYRNPMELAGSAGTTRSGRLAQERGLPTRLTGGRGGSLDDRAWGAGGPGSRKEIVIENDIAWRVHTMVDFLFGQRVRIRSNAREPEKRALIERVLDAIWEESGGIGLLQDMALLGHVYGHVDLLVRARRDGGAETGAETGAGLTLRGEGTARDGGGSALDPEALIEAARGGVRLEVIEPTRGVALLSPGDYRIIAAYVLRYEREELSAREQEVTGLERWRRARSWREAARRMMGSGIGSAGPGSAGELEAPGPVRDRVRVTEVIGTTQRRVYETDASGRTRLVESSASLVDGAGAGAGGSTARVPVVHIQNLSQPFVYEGLSEVEALIPLQDELNTRLSDRANRVTMQSFRMYLAKGLESAERLAVSPGALWTTDNAEARVESFGGDQNAPSEDAHIEEIREALDKQSAVPPLATGVVRAKVGNLSSETALRLTLTGLLSKTARKQVLYGRGIAQASQLALEALDAMGVLRTEIGERGVRIEWPDPLPTDEKSAVELAMRKVELGVPRERVLGELGYRIADAGVE